MSNHAMILSDEATLSLRVKDIILVNLCYCSIHVNLVQ